MQTKKPACNDVTTSGRHKIKQQIIATLVVVFMFLMVFGALNQEMVSANFAANLIENFVSGSLQLEGPTSIAFSDINVGSPSNSLANLDTVNIRDTRGSGGQWSVVGSMNNMLATNAGARNFLDANNIAWFPGNATLTGLDGSNTSGIALGSNTLMNAGTQRTLINASANNGMGNYILNGTLINIQYYGWGNQIAGTYQNTLTMTIS